jgi:hypothetical protein
MSSRTTARRPHTVLSPARRRCLPSLVVLGAAALLLALLGQAGRPTPALAASWVSEPSPAMDRALLGVDCVTPSFCTAVGGTNFESLAATIVAFNGSSWSTAVNVAGQQLIEAVDCVSPSFCKAVSQNLGSGQPPTTIWSFNGSSWSTEASSSTASLTDVACVSPSFCKAVGFGGAIVSWDGSGWSTDRGPLNSQVLFGVACLSTSFCKAVGQTANSGSNVILTFNGSSWSEEASPPMSVLLRDVACLSTSFCKAVGGGAILSYNGTSWTQETSGPAGGLYGVACVTPSFCKAVGFNDSPISGTFFSYDGTSWSEEASGTSQANFDVACLSTSFCKAVGGRCDAAAIFSLATAPTPSPSPCPDSTPPDTSIAAQPANPTNSTTAMFSFTGTDNVTAPTSLTFECKLDGGAFTPCTSPKMYTGLTNGSHTFQVRAKDAAGNLDASPASYTWTVDTTPPTVTCSASPSQLAPPNHQLVPVTVTVTANDPGNPTPPTVTLVSVVSSEPDNGLGDGDTAGDIQGWATGTNDRDGQLRAERAGGGPGRVYTLTYRATDQAGNTATATCTVTVPRN